MSNTPLDPALIAAFLDGKLEGAERERVLAAIAADPADYETLLEAGHVIADLDRPVGVAPAGRHPRRTVRWGWAAGGALLAASLAALVLSRRVGSVDLSPDATVAELAVAIGPADLAQRLGTNWDQPGWSVVRGGQQDLVASARAFRLGARAVELQLAIRTGDATAVRLVGADLTDLASGLAGGAPSAAIFQRQIDDPASTTEASRRQADQMLRRLVGDSPWFDLGSWAEGARLANLSDQSTYFSPRGAAHRRLETALAKLEPVGPEDSPEAAAIARRIAERIGAGDSMSAIAPLVDQLMAAAGR